MQGRRIARLRIWSLEAMISILYPVDLGVRSNLCNDLFQKIPSCKTVSGPGHEKHRLLDPVEMLVSQLVSLTYRMERISEEEQSIHIHSVGGDLGSDSSAHGLSAYEHPNRLVFAVLCLVGNCPVALLQDLSPVRQSAACLA